MNRENELNFSFETVSKNILLKLPLELIIVIFSYLDEGDEIILRATSRQMRDLIIELRESFTTNIFIKSDLVLIKDNAFKLIGHARLIKALAINSQKGLLYSASEDRTIRVWKLEEQLCIATLLGHTHVVSSLAVDCSNELLFSGSWDKSIRIWSTKSHKYVCSLYGHTKRVIALAYDPNKKKIYSGSEDNTIRVWDAEKHVFLKTLAGHTSKITALAIDTEKGLLYSSADREVVRVWELSTNTCVSILASCGYWPSVLALDTEKKLLYKPYGSSIFEIDLNHPEKRKYFVGHTHFIRSLAFAFEKKYLVSGSFDKTIRVWCRDTKKVISELEAGNNSVDGIVKYRSQILYITGNDIFKAELRPCINLSSHQKHYFRMLGTNRKEINAKIESELVEVSNTYNWSCQIS